MSSRALQKDASRAGSAQSIVIPAKRFAIYVSCIARLLACLSLDQRHAWNNPLFWPLSAPAPA
jgi:hypothetical protein